MAQRYRIRNQYEDPQSIEARIVCYCDACGCDRRTVTRRWPELTGKFPLAKTEAARVICG